MFYRIKVQFGIGFIVINVRFFSKVIISTVTVVAYHKPKFLIVGDLVWDRVQHKSHSVVFFCKRNNLLQEEFSHIGFIAAQYTDFQRWVFIVKAGFDTHKASYFVFIVNPDPDIICLLKRSKNK